MATKYQAGFKKKASGQLAAMEKAKLKAHELGPGMQKYNATMTKYSGLINGLKFPCSTTAEAKKSPKYIAWWKKFAAKDKVIKDALFARVKKIMENAGLKRK
ncbi:hypothetical protein BVY04_05390 [bacterium M21]|nr:hypothetical protein BVY04_05390 [bacterium M21]